MNDLKKFNLKNSKSKEKIMMRYIFIFKKDIDFDYLYKIMKDVLKTGRLYWADDEKFNETSFKNATNQEVNILIAVKFKSKNKAYIRFSRYSIDFSKSYVELIRILRNQFFIDEKEKVQFIFIDKKIKIFNNEKKLNLNLNLQRIQFKKFEI